MEMPSMTLQQYLIYKGISLSDFARKTGISLSWLSRIARNKAYPSPLMIKEINKATKGKVKAADFSPKKCPTCGASSSISQPSKAK